MRVLFTNNALTGRSGTELYVSDVARRLLALGHKPMAWSTSIGGLSDELKAAGIPVVDNLAKLPFQPDIIHGQHHLDTMTALQCLPGVPAVYVCHGAQPWEERPPLFPRIYRYVAVDQACYERIVNECGIDAAKTSIVLNFVDLERFQPRPPLPAKPRRALIFSNLARRNRTFKTIRDACAKNGISVEIVGVSAQNISHAPEKILPQYDLVFAKGRAALEAMAVGCSVIVWNTNGCGPMVTTGEFDRLRALNFGYRTCTEPVSAKYISAQIARYDAADAAAVTRKLRAQTDLRGSVDQIVRIYESVLAEHQQTASDPAAESRAAGLYWQRLVPLIKHHPKSIPPPSKRARYGEKIAQKAEKLARWLRK